MIQLEGAKNIAAIILETVPGTAGIYAPPPGYLAGVRELTRKYGLLAHIRATPGISFSELARRSQITVQSAHAAVRALVDAGVVADATAHAGAASVLRVTEEGTRVLGEAERMLARLDAEFTSGAPLLARALEGMHENPFTGAAQQTFN